MVGRPREFDVDQVLEAAMKAFWANGYEGTSLADLMAATGLHKGSLYQAFGDKHALFLQALRRYLGDMRRQMKDLLGGAETPREGIYAMAHGMLDIMDGESDCPAGCMAINALVEMVPHDTEVRAIMRDQLQTMRSTFETSVARAQDAGLVNTERSSDVITWLILTFMAGLAAELKGPLSTAQAHELLDIQLGAVL